LLKLAIERRSTDAMSPGRFVLIRIERQSSLDTLIGTVISGFLRFCVEKVLGLRHAVDVYPFYGSDAGAALRAGYDIRHALVGPGVQASHGYERTHREALLNTLSLPVAYCSGAEAAR
jgi:putative aminopeptidase FrvX